MRIVKDVGITANAADILTSLILADVLMREKDAIPVLTSQDCVIRSLLVQDHRMLSLQHVTCVKDIRLTSFVLLYNEDYPNLGVGTFSLPHFHLEDKDYDVSRTDQE